MRERMQHTIRFYWKTMVLRIGTSQILSGNPRPVTDDGIGRGAEISHKGFPNILPGVVVVRLEIVAVRHGIAGGRKEAGEIPPVL